MPQMLGQSVQMLFLATVLGKELLAIYCLLCLTLQNKKTLLPTMLDTVEQKNSIAYCA